MALLNKILGWVGLSQFHFYLILLTLAVGLMLWYFICRFGIFSDVVFQRQRFPKSRIIYVNHKGSYDSVGLAFDKIRQDCQKYFKFCKYFGIYYDNPKSVSDPNSCRATLGAIINQGQLFKLNDFVKNNPSYQTTVLPSSMCISTEHPYVNVLSFFIVKGKVYPKLVQYIKKNQLSADIEIMEVYHFVSDDSKYIQFLGILQNNKQFYLWEDLNQPISQRVRN